MKATKGNKEYSIDESQQRAYQDQGFDIKEDDGSVIAYGRGKMVPYGDYMALKKELEDLKAIIAGHGDSSGENLEENPEPTEENPEKEPDKEVRKGKSATQKAGE